MQAKKWEGTDGLLEIHKSAGALHRRQAKKGVFITASEFSKEVAALASSAESKIVMFGGETLMQNMLDNTAGVAPFAKNEFKKIDSDNFTDE